MLFSGIHCVLRCEEGQFLCNNTLSNTILSINEWNYEVRNIVKPLIGPLDMVLDATLGLINDFERRCLVI